jgi:hypothetical protein
VKTLNFFSLHHLNLGGRQGVAKVMLNAITLNSLLHSLDSPVPILPGDFSARYFKKNAARTEGLW